LDWSFYWVEGHQEEQHGQEDFWGRLNNVCDLVTQLFWNFKLPFCKTLHQNIISDTNVVEHDGGYSGGKLAKIPLYDLYNWTYIVKTNQNHTGA
jgi:hypothetical protein